MNESFEQLDSDKKEMILKAAFNEFATKGFKSASTNSIVKEAEIGKGMLFHYFNNKKELFDDLIEIGIAFMEEMYSNLPINEYVDFIEKCKIFSKIKMSKMVEKPEIFNFFSSIYINGYKDVTKEVSQHMMKVMKQVSDMLYQNIDTSYFRDDIQSVMIIKLINWSMDGYQMDLINQFKVADYDTLESIDMKPYWDEYDEFLETLKILYYK